MALKNEHKSLCANIFGIFIPVTRRVKSKVTGNGNLSGPHKV